MVVMIFFVSFAAKRAFDWIKSSINQSINQSQRMDVSLLRSSERRPRFCFVLFHSNNRIEFGFGFGFRRFRRVLSTTD